MEVKLNLPENIARKLQTVENADSFAAQALGSRFEYLEWRNERYSGEAREAAARAIEAAAKLKDSGYKRDQALKDFRQAREDIQQHL